LIAIFSFFSFGTAALLLALQITRWQEDSREEVGESAITSKASSMPLGLGTFIMRIAAGLPLRALSDELKLLREAGAASAFGLSWARAGPAVHATAEACRMWGEALYPSALYAASLWIELLHRVGPPLIATVKGSNPLVAWVLASAFVSGIVSIFVGRECRRRQVIQRVDAWYRRRTRWWNLRWLSFQNSVREKSNLAARLLPHVLLALAFTVSLGIFAPSRAVDVLSDGQTIALIALPVPMILSVRTILSANGSIKNQTVVAAFTSEVQSTASRAPQATSKEAAESTSSTSG
jgi:hypothetical protein